MSGRTEAPVFDMLRRMEPSEKQIEFFKARRRHIGYGGARAGGKSWAARVKLIMLGMRYDGLKMLLIRRTLQDLRENHIRTLEGLLNGYAKYSREERIFKFPNGSLLKVGYCDAERDVLQYQGQEYDVIMFEEATQFPEAWVADIRATNRTTRTDFAPRCYYTCNPGGIGHAWVKRLFVERRYVGNENAEEYEFIRATVDDNPHVDAGYISYLDSLPPARRKAWRDGSWDIYEGQVFEEFTDNPTQYAARAWTHVIKPFEVPSSWTMYRSFDYGYSKPFSVGWWAVDFDGIVYRIGEWYGCRPNEANVGIRLTPGEIMAGIVERESANPNLRGRKIRGVADPAIWDTSGGKSIAEVGEDYRIYFEKGDNKRIAGWAQVHERLKFDEDGRPGMYVFDTCKDFIRTVPSLQFIGRGGEDVDTEGEDHCVAGDTCVWTDNGLVAIRELVGTEGRVYGHDGKLHRYADCRMTRSDAEVFTVEFEDGTAVTATSDHRFMTTAGKWKRLRDLNEGDDIMTIGVEVLACE